MNKRIDCQECKTINRQVQGISIYNHWNHYQYIINQTRNGCICFLWVFLSPQTKVTLDLTTVPTSHKYCIKPKLLSGKKYNADTFSKKVFWKARNMSEKILRKDTLIVRKVKIKKVLSLKTSMETLTINSWPWHSRGWRLEMRSNKKYRHRQTL